MVFEGIPIIIIPLFVALVIGGVRIHIEVEVIINTHPVIKGNSSHHILTRIIGVRINSSDKRIAIFYDN